MVNNFIRLILVFILVSCLSISIHATDFYIDYENGNDTNDGLSNTTAWKHAPGMNNCSDNCIVKRTAGGNPGDRFILKGGVTWSKEALAWDWYFGSGNETDPIYFGVDKNWYSGSSWSRPILDAEGTEPTPSPEGVQTMMRAYGSWIIVDNFEFTGVAQLHGGDNGYSAGCLSISPAFTHEGGEVKNCYFHGWSHGPTTGGVWDEGEDMGEIAGDNSIILASALIVESPNFNLKIHDNVWDGSDTTGDMAMAYKGSAGHFYNNYIANMTNGIVTSGGRYYWGNTFKDIAIDDTEIGCPLRQPTTFSFGCTTHGNSIESMNSQSIIYNNIFQNVGGGVTLWTQNKLGDTDYIFNNVIIDDTNMGLQISTQSCGTCLSTGIHVFGNTFHADSSALGVRVSGPAELTGLAFGVWRNNHLIGNANPLYNFGNIVDQNESNIIGMTNVEATNAGYLSNETYPNSPPIDGVTIDAGLNLASLCESIPSTFISNATAACLSDTTLGVHYNSTDNTISSPYRISTVRSTWDVGAYESDSNLCDGSINFTRSGSTITACSCNRTEVQAAVDNATDGDTVIIPEGSCVWDLSVSWTDKNINIIGAGQNKTIIHTNAESGFVARTYTKAAFRISSMTINQSDRTAVSVVNTKQFPVGGTYSTGWRLDHLTIIADDLSDVRSIFVFGLTYGIIDHINWSSNYNIAQFLTHYAYTNDGSEADGEPFNMGAISWDLDYSLGDSNAIYVEDSNIAGTDIMAWAADVFYGGSVVFRRNNITKCQISTHSARYSVRGGKRMEVYQNSLTAGSDSRVVWWRSGSGVVFENTIHSGTIQLDNQRTCLAMSSRCNGSSEYDGNIYEDGWPCLDQPGIGSGAPTNQTLAPIYAWNNGEQEDCRTNQSTCANTKNIGLNGNYDLCLSDPPPILSTHIKTGSGHDGGEVDYVNNGNIPKPDYVPYIYPHPLTKSGNTCLPTENFVRNNEFVYGCSCEQTDVQNAVDNASDGDTVIVPEGSCIWNSTALVSNKITLRGAGINQTVIIRNPVGIAVNLLQSGSRVTGFTFYNASIRTDGDGWRVDHCSFNNYNFAAAVDVRGTREGEHSFGVVDHCFFYNGRILVNGWAGLLAHELWSTPLNLGTYRYVYVEDSEFISSVHSNAVDTNYGGSYVFRNNLVYDTYIEAHSVQGDHRATRKWEIYNNEITLIDRVVWSPFFIRGGTGVIFNNSIIGSWTLPQIVLDNVRSCNTKDVPGKCDGSSPWDGNEPIKNGTGIHEGEDNTVILTDSEQNWIIDSLINITLYNLDDESFGIITSNTATTVTATLANGTDNDWDIGDNYKITDGYPCRDQIGRSTDSYLWTPENPYPPQEYDPAYEWNNTHEGSDVDFYNHNCDDFKSHLTEDREYYNDVKRPSYVPFDYPHPFVSGIPGVSLFSENNLVINETTANLTCSVIDSGALANITLYGNWSDSGNGWHANETVSLSSSYNEITFTKMLSAGSYMWNCEACDIDGNCDFGNMNYTVTITSGSVHEADTNNDGVVSSGELDDYVSLWRGNSVTINYLFEAIRLWKNG